MKFAAFFRNLDPGRPSCPSRAQFEKAFVTAGAESAASFLTNGTLVFAARNKTQARKVLALASEALHAECGLKEPAHFRDLGHLAELVALDPFAAVERSSVYEVCVSFLDPMRITLPAPPLVSRRGDVEVLRFTKGEALSVCRKIGNTRAARTHSWRMLLGAPTTTRTWNTPCAWLRGIRETVRLFLLEDSHSEPQGNTRLLESG
jgi:uncharacterized protein (DUF1697 family)